MNAFALVFFIFFTSIVILISVAVIYSITLYRLPKVIYTYWDDLENNDIIKSIIATQERNIPPKWKLKVISKNNIDQYVDFESLERWKELDAIKFSDFLRVYLLSKYGGVWMDAGIIVINGNFLENYYQEMTRTKSEVLLYEYKYFSLENQQYLENWFLMCPINSKFMNDLYTECEKSLSIGFEQYRDQQLLPHVSFENLMGLYLLQHGIISYLVKKNQYSIIVKDAQVSMFKAHTRVGWDEDLIKFILENNDWMDYYAIKLVGRNRKGIEFCKDEFISKMQSL